MKSSLLLPFTLLLALPACGWMDKKDPPGQKTEAEVRKTEQARLRRACASEATYDRLKELAFDEATRIRNQDPRDLDVLATNSVVRMEEPVVKARDEALNVTVCEGRFILELPPGVENAFDGERRLTAEIEYAAQEAVDGSGMVYHMTGAEPIVYRLATAGGARVRMADAQVPAPVTAEPAAPVPPPVTLPAPSGVPAAPRVPAAESPPVATTPPPRRVATAEAPAPRTAASPSFNCARGRSRSEQLVCRNGGLAALDRQMSSQFYSELADGDAATRRALRSSRDRFLSRRERCSSEACVASAYRERMQEIAAISGR